MCWIKALKTLKQLTLIKHFERGELFNLNEIAKIIGCISRFAGVRKVQQRRGRDWRKPRMQWFQYQKRWNSRWSKSPNHLHLPTINLKLNGTLQSRWVDHIHDTAFNLHISYTIPFIIELQMSETLFSFYFYYFIKTLNQAFFSVIWDPASISKYSWFV